MAKDSDYKFSLQFEVSGDVFSPFCDGCGVGMGGSTVGSFPRSLSGACDVWLSKEG